MEEIPWEIEIKMADSSLILAREAIKRQKEEVKCLRSSEKKKIISLKGRLIKEVKKMPGIWDRNSANYRKKHETTLMWSKIATNMGLNKEWCKKTWRSLVDNFRSQLSEITIATPNVVAFKDKNRITWPYFDSMLFMQTFLGRGNLTCNIPSEDVEDTPPISEVESQESLGNSSTGLEMIGQSHLDVEVVPHPDDDDDDDWIRKLNDHDYLESSTHSNASQSNTPSPIMSQIPQNIQSTRQCKKRQNSHLIDKQQVILGNELVKINEQIANTSQDTTQIFGNYIVRLIQALPEDKRRRCEEDVSRLVYGYTQGRRVSIVVH